MNKRTSCIEIESVIGESPFEFNELVVHILSLFCISQVDGKTKVIDVWRLRTVNHTFREQIDTSILLWRFIVRCTRRGMIEPPLPIPSNTIAEMKKFITLENQEFVLRDYLIRSRQTDELGWLAHIRDPYTFDYREVNKADMASHGLRLLSKGDKMKFDKDIHTHRGIMIDLNKLLR